MKISSKILEKKLKLKFYDPKILIKSLTHKSYDSLNNNEKLEFLGDRVLGLIIAKKLLELYPEEREGVLDKKFASLVNKKKCLEVAKKINLENYDAVIFTSSNAIKFMSVEKFNLKIKCFCVGRSTELVAKQIGFINTFSSITLEKATMSVEYNTTFLMAFS